MEIKRYEKLSEIICFICLILYLQANIFSVLVIGIITLINTRNVTFFIKMMY
jgi:hypothetical protein